MNLMTPEKAFEIIKDKLPSKSRVINEALTIIQKAIDYRTPKNPNGVYDENESLKNDKFSHYEQALIGQCPNCNQEVQEGMDFCMKCGKALDWSDKG